MRAPAALAGASTGAGVQWRGHPQHTTTLDELLSRISISDIVRALGGPEIRRGRCRAWWRDGGSCTSVSLDDAGGRWYDHGAGRGGGVLALVEAALGCSRREAAAWLADYHGVSLAGQTRAQARAWATRRRRAEPQADDLTAWRRARLLELRRRRNLLYRSEAITSAAARVLLALPGADDNHAWDIIWRASHDDLRGDAVQHEIDRIAAMTPRELTAYRARQEAQAA